MKHALTLLALTSALVITSLTPAKAADAHTTAAFLANIEAGTYATAYWRSLGGAVRTGGGIFAEVPLSAKVGLRLSAEADSWKPNDSFVDRAWIDLRLYAPVSGRTRLYGLAGFGYAREGEDILARAGAGIEADLLKLGPVKSKLFLEGSLQASSGQYKAAALGMGIKIGF